MKPLLPLLPITLLILIYTNQISAQAPAPAPGPPGPTNVTGILDKAGRFTSFIRLLDSTKVRDQIKTQLNDSNQGLTIFAPTDSGFSNLKAGMLNSFTDQQKVEMVQFHILPTLFSLSQFQTASNPLRTQAGGSEGSFPLNVTTTGNSVNITTGVVNATVANTVYTDDQLAIYEVDHVLLPLSFFQSPAPAPAPSKAKAKKEASTDSSSDSDDVPAASSAIHRMGNRGSVLLAMSCIFSVLAAVSEF